MVHQGNKENKVQLDLLAAQAQMAFLELMDKMELQEEMVHQENLVYEDSVASLDQ